MQISNLEEYDSALLVVESLWDMKLEGDEELEFEQLINAIVEYEDKNFGWD